MVFSVLCIILMFNGVEGDEHIFEKGSPKSVFFDAGDSDGVICDGGFEECGFSFGNQLLHRQITDEIQSRLHRDAVADAVNDGQKGRGRIYGDFGYTDKATTATATFDQKSALGRKSCGQNIVDLRGNA